MEQILLSSRIISSSKRRYRCYTLSLKCSGEREFILLRHGALKAIMRDAKMLSEQLGLPLPENDFKQKQEADYAKIGPFFLIFSLIWLFICGSGLWKTWKVVDTFPRILFGIHILIGLFILKTAIKQMISRYRK